jgi:DNA transformation protein and related proteins
MVYRPLRYEQIMQAADAYEVRARRMFGGMGIYTGERMFAFLLGEEVALKLAPDDYSNAMNLPGAGVMRPEPDAEPMREYVTMPKAILDNSDEFLVWLEKSAEYVKNRGARIA